MVSTLEAIQKALAGLAIAAETNEYEASCRDEQIGSSDYWASVETRLAGLLSTYLPASTPSKETR